MADAPFNWSQWIDTAKERAGYPTQYFFRLILDLWRRVENLEDSSEDEALGGQIAALWKEFEELKTDFGLEVAKGNIAGHSSINKFGRNIEVDSGTTADIWDGGQATAGVSLIWVAPTAARTHTIASTSASDTSGGAGARTVKIYGLTAWNTAETSETVTMDTASPPVTSNSYVIIHRMKVVTKGGSGPNVGIITATAASDGTVTAQIRAGVGQTHMAIYGVPSGHTLYINDVGGTVNKAGGAAGLVDMDLLVNQEPDVEITTFVSKHPFGLQTVGSSGLIPPFVPPKIIQGPAIVKAQCVSGTNNMDVSGWFNGYVVTNGF